MSDTNKQKIKNQSFLILAIVFVAYSVVAFVLPLPKNGVFWIAYAFAVVALGVQIPADQIAFSKGKGAKSKFYGFPIARIAFVYAAAQLILSSAAMLCASFAPMWLVVIVFTLTFAAASIGFIAADAMRDEIHRQDKTVVANVRLMRELQSKMRTMPSLCEDAEAKTAVTELEELMRYSDPVSNDATAEIESELAAAIDELQQSVVDGDTGAILGMCKKCTALLNERNSLCELNK